MKIKFMRVVITLIFVVLLVNVSMGQVTFRPLMNVTFDKPAESPVMVGDKPLVTRRIAAPSEKALTAAFVSFSAGLYPEIDGQPVVLDNVKFKRVSFTAWIVRKDGKLEYTGLDDVALVRFAHESNLAVNSGVFTTLSRETIAPNSPASGSFKNATVQNVGAIYLTRRNIHFGPAPYWPVPKLDEGYQMDFKFELEVTHLGVVQNVVIDGKNGLTAKYLVSDKTPEIVGLTAARSGSPEVVMTKGEDVRQFRMRWSENLGPGMVWQLILPPPTVEILQGGYANWVLPEMPATQSRYYVLEWTPDPQFHVPQYPIYNPDTTAGIEARIAAGNSP